MPSRRAGPPCHESGGGRVAGAGGGRGTSAKAAEADLRARDPVLLIDLADGVTAARAAEAAAVELMRP